MPTISLLRFSGWVSFFFSFFSPLLLSLFIISLEAFYDGCFLIPIRLSQHLIYPQCWHPLTAVSQPPCDCLALGLMSEFLLYLGYLGDLVMEIWILFNLTI